MHIITALFLSFSQLSRLVYSAIPWETFEGKSDFRASSFASPDFSRGRSTPFVHKLCFDAHPALHEATLSATPHQLKVVHTLSKHST